MTKKYLQNPFNALDRDNILLSDCPVIAEINEYAKDLEDKIEGDFELGYIDFEFNYNRLAYIRNGLLLAKLKFLKLYKRFGDGTFASFCRERLRITRWQVNDNIKAARVAMELIYAGFEILPTNISQAMALASLTGEKLIEAWTNVVENIAPDEITHKSIRSLLFPPTESGFKTASIQVPHSLHEEIHREAAERGMAIAELLRAMLSFFIGEGDEMKNSDNSHLLQFNSNIRSYKKPGGQICKI